MREASRAVREKRVLSRSSPAVETAGHAHDRIKLSPAMDPPARPASQRRAAMGKNSNPAVPQKYSSDGSPCPFVTKPKPPHISTDVRRPSSRSQTVSIGWEDDTETALGRASRLQIELAECVETKTVTTTTTTKRSYPPLLIQQKSLETLDAKEYPLASKPTPAELTKISYDVDLPNGRLFGGSPTPNRRKVRATANYVRKMINKKLTWPTIRLHD